MSATLLNSLARLLGYLKYLAIAVVLGYQTGTDAFFLASGLTGISTVFVDAWDSLGIPSMVRAKKVSEGEFRSLTHTLFTFTVIFAGGLSLLNLALATQLDRLPLGFDPEARELTRNMLILLTPSILLSFLLAYCSACLRAERRFHAAFVGPLLFSFFSLVLVALLLWIFRHPYILPVSISAGMALACLYAVKIGKGYFRFGWALNETKKRVLKDFVSLSALYASYQLLTNVDRAFASYLPEKSLSALVFGATMAFLPLGIFSLAAILITPLSENEVDSQKLHVYLIGTLLLAIAAAAFVWASAGDLITLFLAYGALKTADIQATIAATSYYALSLPLLFLWSIYARVFQVLGKLKVVTFMVIVAVAANATADYFLVFLLDLGLIGPPLGTLVAYSLLVAGCTVLLAHLGLLVSKAELFGHVLWFLAAFSALGLALSALNLGAVAINILVKVIVFLLAGSLALQLMPIAELRPKAILGRVYGSSRPQEGTS